jgi:hypothetical protein
MPTKRLSLTKRCAFRFLLDALLLTLPRNARTLVSLIGMSPSGARQPAQTCAPKEKIGATTDMAIVPISDAHEVAPRCAVSARHRVFADAMRLARGDTGALVASGCRPPALAAPGEHAPASVTPFASRVPRLRAGRRLWAIRAHPRNGISPAHDAPTMRPTAAFRCMASATDFSWLAPSSFSEPTGRFSPRCAVANW